MKFWQKIPIFQNSPAEDEARLEEYQDIIFNIEEMISKMKFYQEGVILFQTIKEINNSDTLLAPSVIYRITRLDSQIEQYLKSTLDYVHDEDIHTMCAELRDGMLHLTRAKLKRLTVLFQHLHKSQSQK